MTILGLWQCRFSQPRDWLVLKMCSNDLPKKRLLRGSAKQIDLNDLEKIGKKPIFSSEVWCIILCCSELQARNENSKLFC